MSTASSCGFTPGALFCAALFCAGLPGCGGLRTCPTVSDAALGRLPARLSESGLYADISTRTLSPDLLAFEPRFPLWSDGATKTRWLSLPPGSSIDATDVDSWRFPVGTRAWKEFAVDGVPVETRMIEQTGAGEWSAVAYRWEGDDGFAVREGTVDANGSSHDIPSAEQCQACHAGRSSFILGFSAVQLAGADGVNTESLAASGSLAPEPGQISAPAADEQALGYLHANCSHCHNPDRGVGVGGDRCYDPDPDLDWTLPAAVLGSVDEAPALQKGREDLAPGHSDRSEVIARMSARNTSMMWPSMPPLGSEEVDEEGVAMLRAWIDGLQ